MGKKKRKSKKIDLHEVSSDKPINNPFNELAHLRDSLPQQATPPQQPPESNSPMEKKAETKVFSEKVVVRHEWKGHGGKAVTRISGILLEGKELKDYVRSMRKGLGCAGRQDGSDILLSGEIADRVTEWLEARGAHVVGDGN